MTRRPDHFVVNWLLKSMVNSSLHRDGQLPVPVDHPVVHAAGTDPDRLLLLGSGPVAGIGVTSHQIGIGGQLARRVSALTGRGVDLELMGADDLMIDQVQNMLDATDLSRFDAIVLMVGICEASRLSDLSRWRTQVVRLLETASAAPQVFAIGVSDFAPYIEVPRLAARAMRRHGVRLNEITQAAAADIPGVQFVPFEPERPDHFTPFGSVKVYELWADAMAPAIAAGLDPAFHAMRSTDRFGRKARQHALDALGVVDGALDMRIIRIARTARDLLGASGAAVSFLDGPRLWTVAAVSTNGDGITSKQSFCRYVIARPEVFVVEDALKDPRFAAHPDVVNYGVRFYAGFPIETRDGVPVGALCVLDKKPRSFSDKEAALLRELALQVQAVLWESSARPSSLAANTLGE